MELWTLHRKVEMESYMENPNFLLTDLIPGADQPSNIFCPCDFCF